MKLLLKGEIQAEGGITSAIAGARCDTIALDLRDVMYLHRMVTSGSQVMRDQLGEMVTQWACHFVP